jgi:ribose-phosphate pyrophosphokinase
MKIIDLNKDESEYHLFTSFSLGERKILYRNVAENDDILITQRIHPFESAGEKVFDLILALQSLPSNCNISLFLPYLYYSRQDKDKNSALDLLLRTLSQACVKELLTFDVHNKNINMHGINLVNHSICDLLTALPQDHIIISPDIGGYSRGYELANKFGLEHSVLEKARNTSVISHNSLDEGKIKRYKKAIILDDIIDSGNTIFSAIDYLEKSGIEEFEIIVTHYISREELFFSDKVKKITTTNSIAHSKASAIKATSLELYVQNLQFKIFNLDYSGISILCGF